MSTLKKTLEFKVERRIRATPNQVFNAWLDPKVPGNPWNIAENYKLAAELDGLFYWTFKGTAHYGRFTSFQRPSRLSHTWVSRNTSGEESTVSVTFVADGNETIMTLIHSNLPDTDGGRSHEGGWNFFLNNFKEHLEK